MSVRRVVLDGGRAVAVKTGHGLAAEAAGLRWLRVPGGPRVPTVLDEVVLRSTGPGAAGIGAAGSGTAGPT